jgi:peptidoglycan/LPS O-acetylase OafA/YrhL
MNVQTYRIFGLDIIRAFAILTVVFSHSLELLPTVVQQRLVPLIYDGVNIFLY